MENAKSKETMSWKAFLNQMLEYKQIQVLKQALKIKAPVHFYGTGLGKSILVDTLKAIGFNASDPAEINDGISGSCAVPDGSNRICFNVKKGTKSFTGERLREDLVAQKSEIIEWVNT